MVYQPHRYSRTLELFDQFIDVLSLVDRLLLLETYAAGEKPILGALGHDLYRQLSLKTNVQVTFLEVIADVPQVLDDLVEPGDLVLTQGAGETAQLAQALTKRWQDWRLRA